MMQESLVIRNGRVLDPSGSVPDEGRDLWIVDGVFAARDLSPAEQPQEEIDASGMLVMPGLVDVHVHLREPGNDDAETIASGCAAAVAGGFTSIVCMPNTSPTLDTPGRVRDVIRKAEAVNGPRVYVMAAITKGREGKTLNDLAALAEAGAVGFTDDGAGVQDAALIRRAMEQCAKLGRPIVEHCEDSGISAGGVMHEGDVSARLGFLPGIPAEAESAMVERDIGESARTGARLHLQHISAQRSIAFIRDARKRGARVTAEVTPHHLTLADTNVARGDTNFKMNPPLRSGQDRDALRDALRDGVLGIIATDHAPHAAASKARMFRDAPFGVIGMETAAAVVWTSLVREGFLSPLQMADRMSAAPAAAFGLPAGTLQAGSAADVMIFDPSKKWTVEPERFRSRSRNCPFAGWELQGRVAVTIVAGKVKYRDDLR